MRAVLASAFLFSCPFMAANADDGQGFYGEAGYAYADFDEATFNSVGGRAGFDLTKNFGLEGEAFFGVSDETTTIEGFEIESSLNYQVGLFGTARTSVGASTEVYGRLGYASAEIEASAGGASVSASEEAFVAGLGVRHFINDGPLGVRGDVSLADFDGGESTTFSLTVLRKF